MPGGNPPPGLGDAGDDGEGTFCRSVTWWTWNELISRAIGLGSNGEQERAHSLRECQSTCHAAGNPPRAISRSQRPA